MRIILFLSIVFVQTGFGQALLQQQIDFSVNEKAITETLQQLSDASKVDIAFSANFFDSKARVSFHFEDKSLEFILSSILKNTNVGFKPLRDRVLLFLKKEPPQYTISGYVKDEASGERLIAATIYSFENSKGAVTNEYGFYSLTLPRGNTTLQIQFLGYQEKIKPLNLDQNLHYDITLKTNLTLPEVIVNPETYETAAIHRTPNNVLQINKDFVKSSPELGGEEDVIRTAQLLPGIQGGGDGLGGVLVRGGESGQNLMLMDGVPVYIPYHLLGVYSVYNSSVVNSAQLLKGSFSARYGGRLSSVFDIRTKEGNKTNWSGEAAINLIN